MVFDFSFFFLLLVYLLSIIICIVFSCCLSLSSKKNIYLHIKKNFPFQWVNILLLYNSYLVVTRVYYFFFYNQLTKRQGRQPQIHTIIGTIHTTNKPECENEREREREKNLQPKKLKQSETAKKKNTKKKNLFPLEFSFLIFIFIESFPIDLFFNSFWDLFYSTNLIIYKSCQNQLVLQIYQIKGMYLRKNRSRGFKQGTDQKQHDQKEKKNKYLKTKQKIFLLSRLFVCLSVCLFDCWLV